MAKFHGLIGFATQIQTADGVWEDCLTERVYYGDIIRSGRRIQSGAELNDDINFTNEISIVADPFANQNLSSICCVSLYGTKWKITNVEVLYPRLRLTVGGVYNEQN